MGRKRSPTQLSLDFLNKSGWTCARVEHWNAFAKIRQDLFGWADIIAYKPEFIALIQTTDSTSFSKRRAKILASPHFAGWKKAGGVVYVHAWGPNGLRSESL